MLSLSGVEVLLKQYAPHLLNIDGDSYHHVHNITKALCEPFESWLERLFTDLHLDFKYCSQYKKIMTEICRICDVNFTAPKRFISHRWLNAYDQAIETSRLLNVYIIFYSAFLPVHLREQYTRQVNSLIQKIETYGARERVRCLLSVLKAKPPSTSDGRNRKERILDRLFLHQEKTLFQLQFYQASMFKLKKFVLKFQKKKPLIHKLFDDLALMAREFLVKFLEPHNLKGLAPAKLKELKLTEMLINKREEESFIGSETREIFYVANDDTKRDFIKRVKEGYLKAGKTLLRKLPLDNTTLEAISFSQSR